VNESVKKTFLCISSSKVDLFTSKQDQNDHRPILQINGLYISQVEMLCFVISVICNYAVGPHVTAATIPTCLQQIIGRLSE